MQVNFNLCVLKRHKFHILLFLPNKRKACHHQCLLSCCIKISPSFYSEMVPIMCLKSSQIQLVHDYITKMLILYPKLWIIKLIAIYQMLKEISGVLKIKRKNNNKNRTVLQRRTFSLASQRRQSHSSLPVLPFFPACFFCLVSSY